MRLISKLNEDAKRLSLAFVAVLLISGCAALAPGADPVVVRTEQTLAASDAVYRDAMAYYFRPGVAPTLSPQVTAVFEKVRTGFDRPYKATQAALNAYKAGKGGDPLGVARELAALVNELLGYIPANALKDSNGQPVEVR